MTRKIELIETHRLKGERICEFHWNLWLNMGLNAEVMATLGGTWNLEKAQKAIKWNCEQWEFYGHGQWMFFDKETETFVGRGGIRKVIVNGNEEVELGYALMPEFWGKGLAVEIGKKALSITFDNFCYYSVVCYTLNDNKRSEKVMQKIGFSFETNIMHANMPHVLYRYQNPKYRRCVIP
ncbi:GNAT family N-acetyltransferase [Nostoc punctiforme FACHB-252]|uniref:GNAT family N-acetyltransferase n=1 Tax=Nostoc punctiforme FACHB-252 TaxID=1357509 RepID=A0ABR8HAS2_NOSPU|nr:GNAT family N-acetyltransferase [Nostoc punctiforme]MBD2612472.1 GNAT family N-acetyltransferase [Nostoc punctiforme FACHB-252]